MARKKTATLAPTLLVPKGSATAEGFGARPDEPAPPEGRAPSVEEPKPSAGGTQGNPDRAAPQAGEASHHAKQARWLPTLKTVLIVDDNELDRKLFSALFRARGCATLQARNGREVVKLAREHLPDLIVMDIQLPEWSGLEITQRLKADDDLKRIPIVAVTALVMEGDRERILDGGCDAYLAKPISVTDFFQTIGRFLD